jgi:4-hydroxybenzoate polyprenyltransferase
MAAAINYGCGKSKNPTTSVVLSWNWIMNQSFQLAESRVSLSKMLLNARRILEMIRFSHTLFALPFALLAACLAWREVPFQPRHLLGIVLAMVFARSTAMAFNRLVDRHIDAGNPRTALRHIPAGTLSVGSVVVFTVCCCLGFVLTTLLFLPNWLPLILSVPVLAFLCGYSFAKRFTIWCHYWLAAALMLSPVAVWIALCGTVTATPVLLALVIFFWVGGFDIIYACQDADFDRQKRLHSIPAKLGIPGALRLAAFSHLLMLVCLGALWYQAHLQLIFGVGVIAVSVLLIYEHSLVRPDDLTRVNLAFFHVNTLISVGLLILGMADLWL